MCQYGKWSWPCQIFWEFWQIYRPIYFEILCHHLHYPMCSVFYLHFVFSHKFLNILVVLILPVFSERNILIKNAKILKIFGKVDQGYCNGLAWLKLTLWTHYRINYPVAFVVSILKYLWPSGFKKQINITCQGKFVKYSEYLTR